MASTYVFHGTIEPERARVDIPSEITTTVKKGKYPGKATVHINAGEITVNYELKGDVENLIEFRNLVENILHSIIDPLCFLNGISLRFEIASVLLPDGGSITYGVNVPEVDQLDLDGKLLEAMTRIMGLFDGQPGTYLRHSLADFRQAMDTPYDTGFYCYRAVESVKQNFQSWHAMREALDIEEEDIRYIKQFADDRRHGDIGEISGDTRKDILPLTRGMILKYIDYLEDVEIEE